MDLGLRGKPRPIMILQNMYTGILAVLMSGSIMWGPPASKKVRNMMTGK